MADLRLADAVDAAEALFQPVRVPGQVVVDHQVGALQMNKTLVHGAFVVAENASRIFYRDTMQLDPTLTRTSWKVPSTPSRWRWRSAEPNCQAT